MKFKLICEEYNLLDRLASASKMDCWFCITEDENGNDIVHDLENDVDMSFKDAFSEFDDGLTDYEDYNMTNEEIHIYENLRNRIAKICNK